jgi:putative copper export protein
MYRYLVILHLIGASVWVGGHLVLSLAILPRALRAKDPEIIRDFEAGFERIGIPALLVQVVTGTLALHARLWLVLSDSPTRLVKRLGAGPDVLLALHARAADRIWGRQPAFSRRASLVTLLGLVFLVLGVAIATLCASSSVARHRYQLATLRCGAQRAPCFATSFGAGIARLRYAIWKPLRMP